MTYTVEMTAPHKCEEKSLPRLDVYLPGNHDGSIWTITDGMSLWESSDPVGKQNKPERALVPNTSTEEHTPCPPDTLQLNTVRVLTSSPLHQQALSGLPGTY